MELSAFFAENPEGALAFSGGVDSSLLAWAAAKYGASWRAYYVRSPFQPAFELEDARRLAAQLRLPLTVLEEDILKNEQVTRNSADRCYHCKRVIFSRIQARAALDGHTLVIDGSNASDDATDRPGMRALEELRVRSPLRECGLSKEMIRALSREAGLFTWDKPSYACLATRIPAGTVITAEALSKIEQGETYLTDLGFSDFRVRLRGDAAILQVSHAQFDEAFARKIELTQGLSALFPLVALDLQPRQATVIKEEL